MKTFRHIILCALIVLAPSISEAVQQGGAGHANIDTTAPAGAIYAYGGTTAPTGLVMCDGASLLRAGTYAHLFAAIGTAWGTADGTHFNVPDLRGRFLRGHDNGAGTDPDAASRTASATGGATGDAVGSVQTDAMQGHYHSGDGGNYRTVSSGGDYDRPWGAGVIAEYRSVEVNAPTADGTNGTPRTTSETRPANAAVNYIIKY